jgi:hypothetical protein
LAAAGKVANPHRQGWQQHARRWPIHTVRGGSSMQEGGQSTPSGVAAAGKKVANPGNPQPPRILQPFMKFTKLQYSFVYTVSLKVHFEFIRIHQSIVSVAH